MIEKDLRRRIVRDESAKALPRGDQPLRAQGGERFANDRPADAGRRHDRLFGRQALAGLQVAGLDLRRQHIGKVAAQVRRLLNGIEDRVVLICHPVSKSWCRGGCADPVSCSHSASYADAVGSGPSA